MVFNRYSKTYSHTKLRLALPLAIVGLLWSFAGRAEIIAAEPAVLDLVPADAATLVEVTKPTVWLDQQITKDLFGTIEEFLKIQGEKSLTARLAPLKEGLESITGKKWPVALDNLLDGNLYIIPWPQLPGQTQDTALILVTAQPETAQNLIDGVIRHEQKTAAAEGHEARIKESKYRDVRRWSMGGMEVAAVGRRILVGQNTKRLEQLLDRQLDGISSPEQRFPQPIRVPQPATKQIPPAAVRITVNLPQIRREPGLQEHLTLPGKRVPEVLFFGGYLEILKRADLATLSITLQHKQAEIRLRWTGKDPLLEAPRSGYFPPETQAAHPVLKVPGHMYSGTFYWNLGAVWNDRKNWWQAEKVRELEDLEFRQARASRDAGVSPVKEMVDCLGPHWRVVVTEPGDSPYKIPLPLRIPSLGVVVDLQDEASFQKKVYEPLQGFLQSPVVLAIGFPRTSKVGQTAVYGLRFHQDPKAASTNTEKYHFHPAVSVVKAQLVLGTTEDVVSRIVTVLQAENLEQAPVTGPGLRLHRVVSEHQLSLNTLWNYLQSQRDLLGASGILTPQLDKQVDLLKQVLQEAGQVSLSTHLAEKECETILIIGK